MINGCTYKQTSIVSYYSTHISSPSIKVQFSLSDYDGFQDWFVTDTKTLLDWWLEVVENRCFAFRRLSFKGWLCNYYNVFIVGAFYFHFICHHKWIYAFFEGYWMGVIVLYGCTFELGRRLYCFSMMLYDVLCMMNLTFIKEVLKEKLTSSLDSFKLSLTWSLTWLFLTAYA